MIKIDNTWEIDSDEYCWHVKKYGMRNKLDDDRKPTGKKHRALLRTTYHGTLSQAFDEIIDQNVKAASTLEEVMTELRRTGDILREAIRNANQKSLTRA